MAIVAHLRVFARTENLRDNSALVKTSRLAESFGAVIHFSSADSQFGYGEISVPLGNRNAASLTEVFRKLLDLGYKFTRLKEGMIPHADGIGYTPAALIHVEI
jgi:hypothetical protein